jgi:hypothetical protein
MLPDLQQNQAYVRPVYNLSAAQQQLLQQQQRLVRQGQLQQQQNQQQRLVQQQQQIDLFDDQQQHQPLTESIIFQEDCCPMDLLSITIPIYKIDNEESVANRIIRTVPQPHFSLFFLFKSPLLKTRRFVDLYHIFSKRVARFTVNVSGVKRPTIRRPGGGVAVAPGGGGGGGGGGAVPIHPLVQIYRCLKEEGYKISVTEYLRLYMFYFLLSSFPPLIKAEHHRNKDQKEFVQRASTVLHTTVIDHLHDILRALESTQIPSRMKELWTEAYIEDELQKMRNRHDARMKSFQESEGMRQEYNRIPDLPPDDCGTLLITGKIISFSVTTQETTGILFDRLRLKPDAPLAKYKDFYKIYAPLGAFDGMSLDESIKEGDTSALLVVNARGNVIAHIINSANGMEVQSMLRRDASEWTTPEGVVAFLGLETMPIQPREDLGITVNFTIQTHRIPFDSSIFSNLCMNDLLFRTFLRVNDSDKISKENHSVYIYYTMQRGAGKKKSRLQEELRIHGWSKYSSRIGDVSATLLPLQPEQGKFAVNVNVTRAANQTVVTQFRETLCKLMHRYLRLFEEQIALFRRYTLDPHWVPTVVPVSTVTTATATVTRGEGELLDPRIFGGAHDWSTVCQIPKGKKNIIRIDAETATQKPDESKILFPPAPYRDIEPAYYYCPDDEFKIVNLVKLDSINHPFGYAPCCTKKQHTEKYTEMTDALRFHIDHGYMPYFTHAIDLKKEIQLDRSELLYDNKLMRFIGQLGKPAPKVDQFMRALIPGLDFFRRSASNWRFDSLLGCLEFHRALSTPEQIMRTPRDLRHALASPQSPVRLEVGAQQNFDIGVDGLRAMLEKWDDNLSADRWIRIMEEFFNVNIFVFTHNISNRKIDIMRPRCYREFLFPFRDEMSTRKIVFLMEHTSGTTTNLLLRYELLVARNAQKKLFHDFDCYEPYFKLLEKAYASFVGDTKTKIPFFNPRQYQDQTSPSPPPSPLPTHQILDCYGKLRALVYENRFPVVLINALAPWNLPLWDTDTQTSTLPTYRNTIVFLERARFSIKTTYLHKGNIVIINVSDIQPLFFLTQVDETTPQEPPPQTIPSSLIGVVEMIRMLLDHQDKFAGKDFLMTEESQRFVNVLRDLCVLRFSLFMRQHLRDMTLHTIPDLMEQFLQQEVVFTDNARLTLRNLHPRMTNNPSLQAPGGKMIMPRILETKMKYCLVWYSITKTKEFEAFPLMVESPSYFVSVTNFTPRPDLILQKTLQPFHNRPYDIACQDPMDQIREIPDRLFFYYRPEETPAPVPYLAFISIDRKEGMRRAFNYLQTGTWSQAPPPPPPQQQQRFPFAQRKMIQGRYSWIHAQLEVPLFYLASIPDTDRLVFLLPLPNPKKKKKMILI